ncbi:MAG: acyl-CoA dehydrogenase family protein [Nitrospinota bacterium]|nr:acyl-CoA dehydrogenase family protein [Nitrospinota bacterium]MDP6366849.1 acyl-CoA dehydrogenase family protein [Nitrospinota bacterium]MDP7167839.1 acyl-CoA dehydrogenase family protein [Nitrospinota bacterium]MDP7371197.1 acyl-CoA dehydrogenase family protein [Nitrospinota bacterium]MDP7663222.1 acyl-CoA dehydrogenase family protein [Nitrospinota bacterium]
MDFQLNDFQRALESSVREFVEREVIPVASEFEHKDEYPHPLVDRMKELGYFGAVIPEENGGAGMDALGFAVLTEELARGWMSLTGVIGSHSMVAWMVARFGSDDQKRDWLPKLASGEMRTGIGITESGGGSDVAALRTTARREGNEYVVNGSKMFVTNSEHATHFGVMVRTNTSADKPHRGISCLMMDRELGGLQVSRHLDKLGYKGIRTGELVFEECRAPAPCLVGEENRGFQQLMATLELGRIQVAARALGLHRACFEASVKYAQQRHTMGKPIAEHQAVQLKLADMATSLDAARQLTYRAAAMKDSGERCDLEAGMAKLFATDAAQRASELAIHIHGGYGYIKELPIERYYRDAILLQVGEGANDIQRVVIARRLVEKYPAD